MEILCDEVETEFCYLGGVDVTTRVRLTWTVWQVKMWSIVVWGKVFIEDESEGL